MILPLLVERLNQLLPEPQASLLSGMLFGIKTTMPPDFYQALIITGTVHMIALSGMNISIVIRLLFDWTSMALGKKGSVMVTIFGIFGFVALVGPSPTIIRAAIMGSLTILATYLGRKNIPLYGLMVATIIMVLFDYSVISNISFQLSFLATLGIILVGGQSQENTKIQQAPVLAKTPSNIPPIPPKKTFSLLKYIWASIKTDLRVTLAAQLFTLPIIWMNFHRISLISPAANIAVGWLVPFIMYGGLLMVVVSLVFEPISYLISLIVWVPLTIFITVITWLSKVPIASLEF